MLRRPATILATSALLAAAVVTAALAPAARADSLSSLPAPDYASPSRNVQQDPLPDFIRWLVYPTIGCPSIVAPGGVIAPVVLLADGGATSDWRARLESSRDLFVQTVPLSLRGATYDAASGTYRLSFDVPAGAVQDTYDLVIESAALPSSTHSDAQPNAVRVWRDTQDYDFIHLCDTQLRDPTTRLPQKWAQLLEEVRLRDPAFSLYSGDLNFGIDYSREYPENREVMRQGGCPLACVPGNHDGYTWMLSATNPLYDGLFDWKRTVGPTDYSLRWGNQRFIALNTFSGPSARRNGYTFMVHNSGGEVDAAQLAWLETEGQAATVAGDEAVVFLHHNPHPSKRLTPDVPGYPWETSLIGAAQGPWNGVASRPVLNRILGDYPALRWVMAGHTNHDEHLVDALGAGASAHDVNYVNTTSPCNGGTPREGYRYVKVRAGKIAEIDYQPAQPSVPFPLGGNFTVTYHDANDGTSDRESVTVASILERPTDVTLKLFMRPDRRGYVASAGRVREVGLADAGAYVVYVRVTVPAQGSATTTVAPSPSGRGVLPAVLGGGTAQGRATGAGGSGGGGGGGCAASDGPGAPSALPTWSLIALALLGAALRRRAS